METTVKVMLAAFVVCFAGGAMVFTADQDARLDFFGKVGVPLFLLGVTVATLAFFSLILIGITT